MRHQALITPSIPESERAAVSEIFKTIKSELGFVPDPLRLYAISPPLLQSFLGTIGYMRGHQTLSQPLLAFIRYLCSAEVGSEFCIDTNEQLLLQMGLDLDQIRATKEDAGKAPLENKEKVMLRLALKSLSNPDGVSDADIKAARDEGYEDRDIFDAVVMAANNRGLNYVLRTFKVQTMGTFTD